MTTIAQLNTDKEDLREIFEQQKMQMEKTNQEKIGQVEELKRQCDDMSI